MFIQKKETVEKELKSSIYLAIEPFKFFIEAEEEHQHFSLKNPEEFKEELIASNRIDHLKMKEK